MPWQPGRPAQYPSECTACGNPINTGDPQVPRAGGYAHPHCANGQDDE